MENHGELHRAILNNIPDQAWLKDTESRYVLVNEAFMEACGRPEQDIIGRTPDQVWSPELGEVYLDTDRTVLESGKRRRYEERRPGPNGKLLWFDTVKMPVRGAHGCIVGTVGISRDITDFKRTETELRDSRSQLRELSAWLQSVRETERSRISRELHDELGQLLSGLRLGLNYLETQARALTFGQIDHIGMLKNLVDTTMDAVHRIASDLRPPVLDELGLHAALEWLSESFTQRTGLPCDLRLNMTETLLGELDAERSIAIFRIVQESLTNASRHGRASRVVVELDAHDNHCHLAIADNGRGMDTSHAANGPRLGLLGMRERALMLGGQLEVTSRPGHGTRVSVCIPLRSSADNPAADAVSGPVDPPVTRTAANAVANDASPSCAS
ncbi:PAS domain-containing sensor histidine kinase [Paraburkholderia sacchari]|uniref:Oxygen sensor histidine kinase NreB n=1 Tax=Paraburkholderia sacchari TaxID=159450 RepID=A0A8T6Z6Z4_9BURK|nr:PAS domain-containing protein [Paraburkholderia sacchari]NLP60605.1 PAS domain-containing protein [Paraburkholderia sacchari]